MLIPFGFITQKDQWLGAVFLVIILILCIVGFAILSRSAWRARKASKTILPQLERVEEKVTEENIFAKHLADEKLAEKQAAQTKSQRKKRFGKSPRVESEDDVAEAQSEPSLVAEPDEEEQPVAFSPSSLPKL